MKLNGQQHGFTLIEMLLYIALVGYMLTAMSVFLAIMLEGRVKNQTIAEVEQQSNQVMELMTQTIRNAEGITSPAPGASSGTLVLDVYDGAADPTTFALSGGTLQVTEGTAGTPVDLNSDAINIVNLQFQNLSRPNTPGVVRITFTTTFISNSGRQEFNYTKDFYATAAVRHPE